MMLSNNLMIGNIKWPCARWTMQQNWTTQKCCVELKLTRKNQQLVVYRKKMMSAVTQSGSLFQRKSPDTNRGFWNILLS